MLKLKDNSVNIKVNEHFLKLVDKLYYLTSHYYYGYNPTITSGNDGTHSATNSLHYKDRAWDLRSRDLPCTVEEFASKLKGLLPTTWDVVVEKDHIHIEADRV